MDQDQGFEKGDPSPFRDYQEAAEAVADSFIGENIGDPGRADEWRRAWVPQIREALERDGSLPNRYEVEALNGGVPEDGSWPEPEEPGDYGCPEHVRAKFPLTEALIAGQF